MKPLLAVVILLGACSAPSGAGGAGAGADTFVASTQTFQPFHGWASFPIDGQPLLGSPHLCGPRTVYLNARPAHGSTRFPVGTVIVKECTADPVDQRKVFAMVKRGGGYNSDGATDWEWFELHDEADGSVSVIWRGVAPPAGESYGGTGSACNDCHAAARDNDFVQSAPLTLTSF